MARSRNSAGFFRSCAILWIGALLSAHARADAVNCLRLSGTNGYASIPHDAALNAFPLTITAWIRTSRNAPLYDGIVNKYWPAAANGYSLHLYNGRLRAWYFRNGSNYVYPGDPGFDGGFVADGQWHHVALVVSASGGTIYIDGASRGTPQGWFGAPGPPTTNTPVTLGRYSVSPSYPNSFAGDMDEVGIWNRALSLSELNYIKHRRLTGNEDGLLSLWHFDEGGGATGGDAGPSARTATLNGEASWAASAAPIVLSPIATNCLRFDGVSGFVQAPHDTNLNAYPFTVAAWFRTTNGAAIVQGIASKYRDGSRDGWSLLVQSGKLRGFYYRQTDFFPAIDASSSGTVADGAWHHAAMTVDASGGKLWLDGNVVGAGSWNGTAGPPTNSEPLLIGHYYTYTERFQGALDEISVWNRALTTNELQSLKNRPLAGNESNLVACWRMEEGAGTTLSDATGHGHNGSFVGAPQWVGSTAYLGDGSVHVVAAPDIPIGQRFFAFSGGYPGSLFDVKANATFWRFYDFGAAPPNALLAYKLDAGLQIAPAGTALATRSNTYSNAFTFGAYNASAPMPFGASSGMATINQSIDFEPASGVQLDSVNHLHNMTETLSHSLNGGAFANDGTEATPPARLLHFNGHVLFGPVDAIVSNVVNTPTNGAITAPSHLAAQLQIAPGGASLAAGPGVHFGGGAAFSVNLGANGFATNVNGSFGLSAPDQFFETAGIRYTLPDATLNNSGITASNLFAWFPTGFGVATSTSVRAMKPYVAVTNIVLGPNLLPKTNKLVFTAASYGTNALYFAEDTKPFFISAPQIEWRIPQGLFYLAQADSLQFVRQQADDELAGQRTNLVVPLAADRISNDGYYHNISATAGVPVYIRADTNGTALLTMQATLHSNEFRPHFPYMNRNVGGNVPMSGGAISFSNDVVDTASSYLLVSGPAPIPYARDCLSNSGCAGMGKIGPQVLPFTAPVGHVPGFGEFSFTPDGGLLAYGSIPPTNLTWGFRSGNDFGLRTSDVSQGAYYFAGTFLKPDDFNNDQDYQIPGRLLLSGYGTTGGVTYVERPGESNYLAGFANYPGLNFRTPAQGRSLLGDVDTGWYPLTARSKYYIRFGGVSGIHESASFPTNLMLYGYPFTFASYRLSYLDNDNQESRTDGQVSLPYPSQFTVEFERMRFLCGGNLDAAELPATIGQKKMVYWNTSIKPLALEFKPPADDTCGFSTRYLVLGVQTRLPFIPEAFHARLGFKNDGNLATPATGILDDVDSRFPVPASLKLQGPGGSYFPVTTAAEGYFNNWEAAKDFPGFFNIVGRLRVPFFRDVKVQLHIAPKDTDNNDAEIAIMGGWPAEEGLGTNRGWNIGAQNYFNTTKFDTNSDGWPAAVNLNLYRHSPDDNYRPRGQRNWIEVANFDYPLEWNPFTREFKGFRTSTVTLPVIDVGSDLKALTPGKVDFNFAEDLDLNLPHIKLLDLANQAVDELDAPFNSLSNAVYRTVNTGGMTKGFNGLQTLLREDSDSFFRPVMETALTAPGSNVVDNLYAALAPLATDKSALLAKAPAIVAASSNQLQSVIQSLNGTASDAYKVAGQISQTISNVDDTVQFFLDVLHKDSDGKRHSVRAIVQQLVHDQGIGAVTGLADPVLDDVLSDLDPALTELESRLLDLKAQFQQLRSEIGGPVSSDLYQSLQLANHDAFAVSSFMQQAGIAVSDLLHEAAGPSGDFFTADPNRARKEIRERLVLSFVGSKIAGNYQQTFRQYFYDKNLVFDQVMNVLFDQINRAIRTGIEQQFGIAGAKDGPFQHFKAASQFSKLSESLLSAKVRGAPIFQGDSLRAIHLDSQIQMHLPDEMDFAAFMDVRELDSASAPVACIPAGGSAAEVTLGANDIPLNWVGVPSSEPGKKLTLSVAAKWTLANGVAKGIGGSLDISGKAGFKGCEMSEIKAALAIGEVENYFAAQAKATVIIIGIPVDFRAGVFAGHACSLDALKVIDPDVEKVVMKPGEFTGVYLEFGGGLSLSDILFGVSSDALDVRADVSSAFFYQGGPRFGRFGGRQKYEVDVKLLGVLEASAGWTVFVVLDTSNQLTVGGSAEACGRLGVCPFCVEGCKEVTVKGVIKDNGIDYFIDY